MEQSKKKGFLGKLTRTAAKFCFALAVLSLAQVLTFKYINPPGTVNMAYEWGLALAGLNKKEHIPKKYEWQDIENISPYLAQAVLASEDQRFLTHNGFDFTEIRLAIEAMGRKGSFRGASTISMQAARSLYLPSSRSALRKLAEAWYTLLMELFWDKKRILEIYLNTVDWGTGIIGAQPGAAAYFSCSAGQLTKPQAALMAAILPSPHKWSAKTPSPYVLKRQARIMEQMTAMPLL